MLNKQGELKNAKNKQQKVLVFSLATRIFHIILIICVAILALPLFAKSLGITPFYGAWLKAHIIAGLVLMLGLLWRILWGFVGDRHSKFSQMPFSKLLIYTKTHKRFLGHNPASSFAIIAILMLGITCACFGLLGFGADKSGGIFANLGSSYSKFSFASLWHMILAYAFFSVICLHICGALLDKIIFKNDCINSMISGFKSNFTGADLRLNLAQKIFAFLWIFALFSTAFYLAFVPNLAVAIQESSVDYKALHKDFAKECGSCHTLYPPFLLSAKSWDKIMNDLENHFGDDASMSAKKTASVAEFLRQNSADFKDNKSSFWAKNYEGIEISASKFWKKAHSNLNKSEFKSQKVKSKSNCLACHKNIENGAFF